MNKEGHMSNDDYHPKTRNYRFILEEFWFGGWARIDYSPRYKTLAKARAAAKKETRKYPLRVLEITKTYHHYE